MERTPRLGRQCQPPRVGGVQRFRQRRLLRTRPGRHPQRRKSFHMALLRFFLLAPRGGRRADRHPAARRQVSRRRDAALRGLSEGERHQDVERNPPSGEEARYFVGLCLDHALLQPSGLLPDGVQQRLGQGSADEHAAPAFRQESDRHQAGQPRRHAHASLLHRGTGPARPGTAGRSADGHTGVDRQFPLHLRGGQCGQPAHHSRHQSVCVGLSVESR